MNKNLKDLKPAETFYLGENGPYVADSVTVGKPYTTVRYHVGNVPSARNQMTFTKVNLTTVKVVG
jgi:hypothetical protein